MPRSTLIRPGKIRITVAARLNQAMKGGTINQKKKRYQKYPHQEGRISASSSASAGEADSGAVAVSVPGVWGTFSAIGKPQAGQAWALVETGFPHSGQL